MLFLKIDADEKNPGFGFSGTDILMDMNVETSEIQALEKWLSPRLGALISHGERVRHLLRAGKNPQAILASALQVVDSEESVHTELSIEQMAAWKALLPILAEHGLRAVRVSGSPDEAEKPLTKEEAAEFLGFSVRKLERYMKKRQIPYEKYGVGQTATVRFRVSELEKFRDGRNIPTRKSTARET